MDETRKIAEWIVNAKYGDFPQETIDCAKGLLLKTITGMVIGAREPIGKTITNYLARKAGLRAPMPPSKGIGHGDLVGVGGQTLAAGAITFVRADLDEGGGVAVIGVIQDDGLPAAGIGPGQPQCQIIGFGATTDEIADVPGIWKGLA